MATRKITQPFLYYTDEIYKLLEINKGKPYVGEIFTNTCGYHYIVTDYINNSNVQIIFLDEFHYRKYASLGWVKRGQIYNYYSRNVNGGVTGIKYNISDPYINKIYQKWRNMLSRVGIAQRDKCNKSAYYGVRIDDSWMNFENFCDWYISETVSLNPDIQYDLDKDLLQWNIENKIYSSSTCIVIPDHLNIVIVGQNILNGQCMYKGISQDGDRYKSQISVYDTIIYLGSYDTSEEAHMVYAKAKKRYVMELLEYYDNLGAISDKARFAISNLDFSKIE